MIPTKTYPLSAIMGNQLTDKERIAELADAFNTVCAENADFVAQSVTDENRIAELEAQLPDEMKNCTIVFKECEKGHGTLTATNWVQHECATCKIAELEAHLKHAEGHAAELEAEVMAWREYAHKIQQLSFLRWKEAREGK